jgi:hypothetical protein
MYELKLVPFQAGSMELAYLDRVGLVGKLLAVVERWVGGGKGGAAGLSTPLRCGRDDNSLVVRCRREDTLGWGLIPLSG